jgi:hypothetical protein
MTRVRRRARAFTLVELLVGDWNHRAADLDPAAVARVGPAERAVDQVHGRLREVGNAFQMYAQEFKGYWPVAVHGGGNPRFPDERGLPRVAVAGPAGQVRRRRPVQRYDQVNKVRQSSVLWGCPEWEKAQENSDVAFADKVRTGYAMNVHPLYPVNTEPKNWATINGSGGRARLPRPVLQADEWTRPTDRGLIADGTAHIVQLNEGTNLHTRSRSPPSGSRSTRSTPPAACRSSSSTGPATPRPA